MPNFRSSRLAKLELVKTKMNTKSLIRNTHSKTSKLSKVDVAETT
jgi:hypothetical protein